MKLMIWNKHFQKWTYLYMVGPRSSVSTESRLRTGRPSFDSHKGQGFFSVHHRTRPALEPTQSPIQWVPGALYPGVKQPGSKADHSPRSSAEVKNAW